MTKCFLYLVETIVLVAKHIETMHHENEGTIQLRGWGGTTVQRSRGVRPKWSPLHLKEPTHPKIFVKLFRKGVLPLGFLQSRVTALMFLGVKFKHKIRVLPNYVVE